MRRESRKTLGSFDSFIYLAKANQEPLLSKARKHNILQVDNINKQQLIEAIGQAKEQQTEAPCT
jgi:hypothetical protein